MQASPRANSSDESFYSIDNSRTDFTVIETPSPEIKKTMSSKLVNLYGIKESSAVMEMSSEKDANDSMHTIYNALANEFLNMNIHQISGINQTDTNRNESSDYLQKQINCLAVKNEPSVEEIQELQEKIQYVKNDQTMIKQQIESFQGMMNPGGIPNEQNMQQYIEENGLMKKKSEKNTTVVAPFDFQWPDPQQLTIKAQSSPSSIRSPNRQPTHKHYDIRPNQSRSQEEQRLNSIYKRASFNSHVTILDDPDNQYRVEVTYAEEELMIDVINYSKGETNFVYAVKINQDLDEGNQRISEKLTYPMSQYVKKKFTLSLNILLLLFEQHKPKEEAYLLKIDQIRTISAPFPLTYLIDRRFIHTPAKEQLMAKLKTKLHIYDITIAYGIDLQAYEKLSTLPWVINRWISLKGSSKMLSVQLGQLTKGKQGQASVTFKIGAREPQCQEAIDLIEYLCFMLVM